MDDEIIEALKGLIEVAEARYDGHFTIMRFTTNWRVGFGTPDSRIDIGNLAVGKNLLEAALNALEKPRNCAATNAERTAFFGEIYK